MTAPQLIIKAHEADPSPCPKYSNLGAVVAERDRFKEETVM